MCMLIAIGRFYCLGAVLFHRFSGVFLAERRQRLTPESWSRALRAPDIFPG